MSENLGSIYYTVDADTARLVQQGGNADKTLVGMQRQMDRTDASAAKLGGGLTKLAGAIAGVLAVGRIADEFQRAVQASARFNAAVAELGAITGASGEALQEFRDSALELGRTTTSSASDAAKAMQLIGSAVPSLLGSAEALTEVTRAAITLADAAGITVPEAASALTGSMNQFGFAADQVGTIINTLAAGAKEGSSEINDTVAAMKNSGTVAARAGLSFETYNAALQVLAIRQIKGAEAGTALRGVLLKLDNAADKNLRPSVVGLSAALDALAKLSPEDQFKLLGQESITAGATLADLRGELETLTDAVTDTSEAMDQAAARTNTLQGDAKLLANAYESLQIAVGDLAEDDLRTLVQMLTEVVRAAAENREALTTAFDVIGIAAQSMAAIIAGRVIMAMIAYTRSVVANTAAMLTARPAMAGFSTVLGAVPAKLTAATVAMNAATIAARGLRVAMAFLGGPAGIILLAGTAIYEYSQRAKDAKPPTDALTQALYTASSAAERAERNFRGLRNGVDALNKQELEIRVDKVEQNLTRARQNLARYTRLFEAGNKSISIGLIDQTKANISELEKQLEDLQRRTQSQTQAEAPPATESSEATKQAQALRDQIALAKLAGEARARLAALQKLGADASAEERKEIEDLAAELYRLEEAQRVAKEATADGAAAAREMQRETEANAQKVLDLEEALKQASMSGAELAQRQAELSLNEYATPEQIARVRELAAAIEKVKTAERAQEAAGALDPATAEAQRYKARLEQIKLVEEAEILSAERIAEVKMQTELEHAQAMAAIQEESFRRQSLANELLMSSLDQLQGAATEAFTGLLTGATNSQQAVQELARGILTEAVSALVKMGITYVKSLVMGQTAAAAATAAGVAQAGVLAGAWATPAALASLASFGANAVPAQAGIATTVGMSQGLAIGARQYGGPTAPGKPYRINENGAPEVWQASNGRQYMLPNTRGDVISNADATSGNRGAAVPVSIRIDASGLRDSREVRKSESSLRRAVAQGVAEANRSR